MKSVLSLVLAVSVLGIGMGGPALAGPITNPAGTDGPATTFAFAKTATASAKPKLVKKRNYKYKPPKFKKHRNRKPKVSR
jgi:hypothetical protein